MMTKREANNAHKRMMAGLKREYEMGHISKPEYDRYVSQAQDAHQRDLASFRPAKKGGIRITPKTPRLSR